MRSCKKRKENTMKAQGRMHVCDGIRSMATGDGSHISFLDYKQGDTGEKARHIETLIAAVKFKDVICRGPWVLNPRPLQMANRLILAVNPKITRELTIPPFDDNPDLTFDLSPYYAWSLVIPEPRYHLAVVSIHEHKIPNNVIWNIGILCGNTKTTILPEQLMPRLLRHIEAEARSEKVVGLMAEVPLEVLSLFECLGFRPYQIIVDEVHGRPPTYGDKINALNGHQIMSRIIAPKHRNGSRVSDKNPERPSHHKDTYFTPLASLDNSQTAASANKIQVKDDAALARQLYEEESQNFVRNQQQIEQDARLAREMSKGSSTPDQEPRNSGQFTGTPLVNYAETKDVSSSSNAVLFGMNGAQAQRNQPFDVHATYESMFANSEEQTDTRSRLREYEENQAKKPKRVDLLAGSDATYDADIRSRLREYERKYGKIQYKNETERKSGVESEASSSVGSD